MTFQALKFTHSIARRPFLLFIEVADARGVRAVTSGPLYRFLLGFECRKNVIGMVLDNQVSDRTSFPRQA